MEAILNPPSRGMPFDVAAGDEEDAAIVRRCRAGDINAFGLLVERHQARVQMLVKRILGATASREDVDDLVQEIFVQAWRALPRFRGDSRFQTWICRIATNMAIKQWHKHKRGRMVVSDEDLSALDRHSLADPAPGPSEEAERSVRDRALRAAIDQLPEKQRTVMILHYFEEFTCEEIAQIIGCSVGTIWSRLHYSCGKLRRTLSWLEQS